MKIFDNIWINFMIITGGPFRLLDIQGTKQFVEKMLKFRDDKGVI